MLIDRPNYTTRLFKLRDTDLIKVITGMRRSGKSSLLKLHASYLQASGVKPKSIQYYNLEDIKNEDLLTYRSLNAHVMANLEPDSMNYVFIDEVQKANKFELAVDSLYIQPNIDLYITGSNSHFLSSELATNLTGRYFEQMVYPLSFAEFEVFAHKLNLFSSVERHRRFEFYQEFGSLPYALQLQSYGADESIIYDYVSGVYDTIKYVDIVPRKKIRSIEKFDRVARFLFDNIGNATSISNIVDTLTTNGNPIAHPTVESYTDGLTESFVLNKVPRFNVKGRQILKTQEKYYATDLGMRKTQLGATVGDAGRELENIVYLELRRRGGNVYVGKVGNHEVDFVVEKRGRLEYYQVTLSMYDEKVQRRELRSLEALKDSYPKTILTLDSDSERDSNGIIQKNIIDWLLEVQ